jgi:hypothetical protein
MTQKFDPVTLEILWRRLLSIVDEADAAVARTAFSSLLRDAHDYTCMFTDRRGREPAQVVGVIGSRLHFACRFGPGGAIHLCEADGYSLTVFSSPLRRPATGVESG